MPYASASVSVHLPGSAKLQAVHWDTLGIPGHGFTAQEQLLKSFGFTVRRLSDFKLGSQLQPVDAFAPPTGDGELTT